MYYIKIFLVYSVFGFIMESTLFKFKSINRHSGIFYGPITAVYGIGILSIELVNKYFFEKIKCHKILKLLIEFIILTIILSVIEGIGGYILNYLFDIDMWDYSNIHPHLGKYICLQNSIIWGILGTIYIHVFKPFTDKLLNQITSKETYFFLILFIIDMIATIITRI